MSEQKVPVVPKFRAWDSVKKEMFKDTFAITESGQVVVVEQEFVTSTPDYVFVDRLIVMQSTGLLDKNGTEIFEGDVLSTYTDNLVIKRDNLLGFYVEVDEKREYFSEIVDIEYLDLFAKDFGVAVEVLGNIYENPELLGQ